MLVTLLRPNTFSLSHSPVWFQGQRLLVLVLSKGVINCENKLNLHYFQSHIHSHKRLKSLNSREHLVERLHTFPMTGKSFQIIKIISKTFLILYIETEFPWRSMKSLSLWRKPVGNFHHYKCRRSSVLMETNFWESSVCAACTQKGNGSLSNTYGMKYYQDGCTELK